MSSLSLVTVRSFVAQVFTPSTRSSITPAARQAKRTLVTLMMLAMLFNQAIASPLMLEAWLVTAAAWQQDAAFRWHAGGWAKLWQQGLGNKAPAPETQSDRDARVSKIRISPNEVTAKTGQTVVLNAIATDFNDNAITGVKFTWSVNDEGRKEPARITSQGEFVSLVPGTFKIMAYSLGRQAHVIIKVVGEPYKVRKPEEIPAGVVSTRDLPLEKKDTSSRFSSTANTQMASLGNKTAQGKIKIERGKPSFKAASNALAAAATLQAYGDPFGWTDLNFMTADDCGKEVGDPPGRLQDDGAGSGNHQFTAPIMNLEGRGLDLSLALSYNARVWHKAGNEITFDIDRDWPAPGFSLGFGKIVQAGLSHGFLMIDGDGTRHGYQCEYSAVGMKCYTNDGSFIDYEVTIDSSTYPIPNAPIYAVAKLPNGTTITYGAPSDYAVYPTKIMDANGNYITISYVMNEGPAIDTITDTLGRPVTFYYDSSYTGAPGLPTAITARDFATGTTRTLVRLQYQDQTINSSFSSPLIPKVRATSFKMLKAIYYPATATGYWLGDAVGTSYSSYGMLLKVCEQRGMSFNNASMNSQGVITASSMPPSHEMSYIYGTPTTTEPMYTETREKWAGMETTAGTPGYDTGTGSVRTLYQVVDESSTVYKRRSTRITRPDGTIQVQWQRAWPGQYDDGLLYYDKTCAAGSSSCTFDGPGEPDNPGLRASAITWEMGYYATPRPNFVYVYYRPWQTFNEQALYSRLTDYEYGYTHNQVIKVEEFSNAGVSSRTTTTSYDQNFYYVGRHIFNLPKIVEVKEGTVVKQKTEYVYDSLGLSDAPTCVQHDDSCDPQEPSYDPLSDLRGLATMVKRYADPADAASAVIETRTYDETGNVRTVSNGCCEQMAYVYTSNTQYGYPETLKRGHATNTAQQINASAVYNVNTGLVISATDANNRITSYSYYESVGATESVEATVGSLRRKKETLPTGAYTDYTYNDAALTVMTETKTQAGVMGAKNLKTLDGTGRVCYEVAYGASSVQDKVDTKYDGLGRVWRQTRPYRTAAEMQWVEHRYDNLERLIRVFTTINGQTENLVRRCFDERCEYGTTPMTISAPNVADGNTKGNTMLTMDAWGRERWARFDWADRLYEVVEPDAAGTGAVTTDGTSTRYAYDCLNNLTQTNQCVTNGVGEQTRTFKYDGLSRLTHQKLAERSATLDNAGTRVTSGGVWSDQFQYDTRSNLTRHVDARGVKTHFNYTSDPLNRLQSVSYDKSGAANSGSDIINAATVTYGYMTAGNLTRLSIVTDGAGTEEFAYDPEGRLCETKRTFTGRASYPLTVKYQYDTLDRLEKKTLPVRHGTGDTVGKLEEMAFDEASRVNELKYDTKTYASLFTYNAASQTTALTVGHSGANYSRWEETYEYEAATGLLNRQKVKLTTASTPVLDLSYEYLKQGTNAGRTGQLTKIVNNKDTNRHKYYEYDTLSRLKKVYSFTGANNPMTTNEWTQTYGYDKFGNRTTVAKTGLIPDTDGLPSLSFTDASNMVKTNRITTAGYSYDEAGNLTRGESSRINGTSVWQKYQYDAAGRLACTKDNNDVLLADYSYGASNQRLKQTEYGSGGATCYYAWDGNSIIGEFNDVSNALVWMKSYVFLGGRLLATHQPGGTNFHHPDRLGTRLVTSEMGGTVTAEQTTLPYGIALDGESYMTPTNQRFTSYDRSAKTKLDYAVNRFYISCQGRFTQVDPIGMSDVSLEDPQSLNLYAYVGDDPINQVDPDGLFWGKLFKWVSRILMWVGIAAVIAMAVLTIAPGAFAGTLIAKISIWSAKHQVLSALMGLHTPKFAILNLFSEAGAAAAGFWITAGAGALNSTLSAHGQPRPVRPPPSTMQRRSPPLRRGDGVRRRAPANWEDMPIENHHFIPWNNNAFKHHMHKLVEKAGWTKADLKALPENQAMIINHSGRHTGTVGQVSPSYNEQINARLNRAWEAYQRQVTNGSREAAQSRLRDVMRNIEKDIAKGTLKLYNSKEVFMGPAK